jgi:hypothetical protein
MAYPRPVSQFDRLRRGRRGGHSADTEARPRTAHGCIGCWLQARRFGPRLPVVSRAAGAFSSVARRPSSSRSAYSGRGRRALPFPSPPTDAPPSRYPCRTASTSDTSGLPGHLRSDAASWQLRRRFVRARRVAAAAGAGRARRRDDPTADGVATGCGFAYLTRHPPARGLGRRKQSDPHRTMVLVLRTMARAVVAAPGLDTATPRANVDLDMPGLLPHLEAAGLPVRGCVR